MSAEKNKEKVLPCTGCGSRDCHYADQQTEEQPCWGQIDCVDEIDEGDGWVPIHVCSGHYGAYDGDPYRPKEN